MDLKEISTPSDLFAANSVKSDLELALNATHNLAPADIKKLILHHIAMLGEAHDMMAESELEDGNSDSAFAWAKDEANLHTAWNIINGIEL